MLNHFHILERLQIEPLVNSLAPISLDQNLSIYYNADCGSGSRSDSSSFRIRIRIRTQEVKIQIKIKFSERFPQ